MHTYIHTNKQTNKNTYARSYIQTNIKNINTYVHAYMYIPVHRQTSAARPATDSRCYSSSTGFLFLPAQLAPRSERRRARRCRPLLPTHKRHRQLLLYVVCMVAGCPVLSDAPFHGTYTSSCTNCPELANPIIKFSLGGRSQRTTLNTVLTNSQSDGRLRGGAVHRHSRGQALRTPTLARSSNFQAWPPPRTNTFVRRPVPHQQVWWDLKNDQLMGSISPRTVCLFRC